MEYFCIVLKGENDKNDSILKETKLIMDSYYYDKYSYLTRRLTAYRACL